MNPGFGVNTKWAYQQLASARTGVVPLSPAQRELNRQLDLTWAQLIAAAENDFESPVFAYMGSFLILSVAYRNKAPRLLLSGSGATVFGVFADEGRARAAQTQFVSDPSMKVFVVPTSSGPLLVQEGLPR